MFRRYSLLAITVVAISLEAVWIIRCLRTPAQTIWPAPAQGFNDSMVDYSAPKSPEAVTTIVPEINFELLPPKPLPFDVPQVHSSHGLIFEGRIRHPNPKLTGMFVLISLNSQVAGGRSRSFVVTATGKDGLLTYRWEERADIPPGMYDVLVNLQYTVPAPESPTKRRMTKSLVAQSTLTVL